MIANKARTNLSSADHLLEQALTTQFDQMYVKWNESKGTRDGLHASSVLQDASEFCYREHILATDFVPVTREIPVKTLRKFWHGWLLHEKWQALFSQEMTDGQLESWLNSFEYAVEQLITDPGMKSLYEELHHEMVEKEKWRKLFQENGKLALEVEKSHYAKKWGLSFTPDAIIQTLGRPFIVEIKGYRASAYENMLKIDNYMGDADFKKAALQANLYMYMLDIPQAIILIENKNTQDYFLSVRRFDLELVKPYIQRLTFLKKLAEIYQEKGTLPRRICETVEETRARNCSLRTACFASRGEREQYRR